MLPRFNSTARTNDPGAKDSQANRGAGGKTLPFNWGDWVKWSENEQFTGFEFRRLEPRFFTKKFLRVSMYDSL